MYKLKCGGTLAEDSAMSTSVGAEGVASAGAADPEEASGDVSACITTSLSHEVGPSWTVSRKNSKKSTAKTHEHRKAASLCYLTQAYFALMCPSSRQLALQCKVVDP